jgi:nicotinate-nucleotide adenylyltransferase
MNRHRIGVGGSAASPITIAHVALLEALANSGLFDRIIWIPSGERSDKPGLPSGAIRKQMSEATFTPSWKDRQKTLIDIRYDDVEGNNMPTADWFRKLEGEYPGAKLTWYTGVDSVVAYERYGNRSEIEALWDEGEDLVKNRAFLVIPREGYPHPRCIKLPPQFQILDVNIPGCSSTTVRERIKNGQLFESLVPSQVATLIKQHRLYGY